MAADSRFADPGASPLITDAVLEMLDGIGDDVPDEAWQDQATNWLLSYVRPMVAEVRQLRRDYLTVVDAIAPSTSGPADAAAKVRTLRGAVLAAERARDVERMKKLDALDQRDRVTAERDAASRERDEARARAAELEAQLAAVHQLSAKIVGERNDLHAEVGILIGERDAALATVVRLNEENTALVRRVAAFELIASEALSLLAHLGKVTLPSRDLEREGNDVTQEVARLRAAMEAASG